LAGDNDKYINKGLIDVLSVYYKIKDSVDPATRHLLACFLDDWIDNTLSSEVRYSVVNDSTSDKNFRIDIENQEHALFLKLVGVPDEFKKYIEISNKS